MRYLLLLLIIITGCTVRYEHKIESRVDNSIPVVMKGFTYERKDEKIRLAFHLEFTSKKEIDLDLSKIIVEIRSGKKRFKNANCLINTHIYKISEHDSLITVWETDWMKEMKEYEIGVSQNPYGRVWFVQEIKS